MSYQCLGVFGGTFDPIHHGHLRCAVEVSEFFDIPVHMIPSADPPHRNQPRAAALHRFEMLKRSISDQSRLIADNREIQRAGPSYMVDTLRSFHDEQPGLNLMLILGRDAASQLQSWHRWQELFELANFLILNRPGDDIPYPPELNQWLMQRESETPSAFKASSNGAVFNYQTTMLDISASSIRTLLSEGNSIDYLMPSVVIEYIDQHQLYQ